MGLESRKQDTGKGKDASALLRLLRKVSSPVHMPLLWIISSVTRTPARTITGQLRSLPELQSSSSSYLVSPFLLQALHLSSLHRLLQGRIRVLALEGRLPSHLPSGRPAFWVLRHCWVLRYACKAALSYAHCLRSAWHTEAFAFGKTRDSWSTYEVLHQGSFAELVNLNTVWISDPMVTCVWEVGVGGEELVYKKFCLHFSWSAYWQTQVELRRDYRWHAGFL